MTRRKKRKNKGAKKGATDSPAQAADDGHGDAVQVNDEWLRHTQINLPESKQPISFRVDSDVLDYFKSQGPRYQTRMNAVLRSYMTAHTEEET